VEISHQGSRLCQPVFSLRTGIMNYSRALIQASTAGSARLEIGGDRHRLQGAGAPTRRSAGHSSLKWLRARNGRDAASSLYS
jgi:hypothetical protein